MSAEAVEERENEFDQKKPYFGRPSPTRAEVAAQLEAPADAQLELEQAIQEHPEWSEELIQKMRDTEAARTAAQLEAAQLKAYNEQRHVGDHEFSQRHGGAHVSLLQLILRAFASLHRITALRA